MTRLENRGTHLTQDEQNEFARCINVRPKKNLSYETSKGLYECLMDEIYAL